MDVGNFVSNVELELPVDEGGNELEVSEGKPVVVDDVVLVVSILALAVVETMVLSIR